MSRQKHLKEKILYVLRKYPISRNSDKLLTVLIWKSYYSHHLYLAKDGHYYLNIDKYVDVDMPNQDDVKRIRAVIQNKENSYLPTSEGVRKQRRISEDNWRTWALSDRGIMDI